MHCKAWSKEVTFKVCIGTATVVAATVVGSAVSVVASSVVVVAPGNNQTFEHPKQIQMEFYW